MGRGCDGLVSQTPCSNGLTGLTFVRCREIKRYIETV